MVRVRPGSPEFKKRETLVTQLATVWGAHIAEALMGVSMDRLSTCDSRVFRFGIRSRSISRCNRGLVNCHVSPMYTLRVIRWRSEHPVAQVVNARSQLSALACAHACRLARVLSEERPRVREGHGSVHCLDAAVAGDAPRDEVDDAECREGLAGANDGASRHVSCAHPVFKA